MGFLTAEIEKEISERFNNLQGNVVFIDIYLPKITELKPDWLKVLELANEGLTDKAIARQMNTHERTVRHYWTKIQNAIDVYPEDGKI